MTLGVCDRLLGRVFQTRGMKAILGSTGYSESSGERSKEELAEDEKAVKELEALEAHERAKKLRRMVVEKTEAQLELELDKLRAGKKEAPKTDEEAGGEGEASAPMDFTPEQLKVLKDMKPEERDVFLASLAKYKRRTGHPQSDFVDSLFDLVKTQPERGPSAPDPIKQFTEFMNTYNGLRDSIVKELDMKYPPQATSTPEAKKSKLEELAEQFLEARLKDLIEGKSDRQTSPEPTDSPPQPFASKFVYDEKAGMILPSEMIVSDPESYARYLEIDEKRQKRLDAKADREDAKSERQDLIKGVLVPTARDIVKAFRESDAPKQIKGRVKKMVEGGEVKPATGVAQEQVATFQCPNVVDGKQCGETVTVNTVNGQLPPVVQCPKCKANLPRNS